MSEKTILIIFISFIVLFTNCNSKYSTKVVAINRIDTSGIYFSYDYLDKTYLGHFDLFDIEEDFSTSDSLKISIEKNQPDKFEYISIVKRIWKTEEVVVSLEKNTGNKAVYSYHDVDKKPLFAGANNEYENDSLIFEFFKRHSNPSNDFKKIGVYILINESGEVTLKNAFTKDKEEVQLIKKLIEKLPIFTPPINEGDSVTVSYLIEIPIFK